MGEEGTSDASARVVSWRLALGLLPVTIAAVATGDLLEVIGRLRHGLASTIGVGGLIFVLLAVTAATNLAVWLLRRPDRGHVDAAAVLAGPALLIGLRMAAALLIDAPLIVDWRRYHEIAVSISQGGDWFTGRPGGYSLLLAAGYLVFGPNPAVGSGSTLRWAQRADCSSMGWPCTRQGPGRQALPCSCTRSRPPRS